MAQKTDADLLIQKQVIESETTANANTAARVGQMFEDIIDSKMNNALLIDEDDMTTNSATRVPSQQSVKAYVDAEVAGASGAVDSVNGATGVVVLDAGDIAFTPAGNIAATDVQAAIAEVDSEKVSKVNSATALTDAGTIDLTAIFHTLSTSSSRTFTVSYTGDDITIVVTLSATSATQTFPAGSLCVSDGVASGDNTCPMAGASGDKYVIALKRHGSIFYVVCKNFGQ